jgi:hypothetical protein
VAKTVLPGGVGRARGETAAWSPAAVFPAAEAAEVKALACELRVAGGAGRSALALVKR